MPAKTTQTTNQLDCYAIVAPGLEELGLAEARALGIGARAEEGGFAWTGDARSAMLANAGLRIASRVVVRLAAFEARSFAELERHARRVPWAQVVRAGDRVRFRVTCKKSKLYHTGGVAQRLADAVMRVVPGVVAEGGSIGEDDAEGGDAQLFVVRFMRDHCTVSADTSGELLHRRGWRQATGKAPLRETIAAAMLAGSEWDFVSPLVDPLCGSGTIPIEAALMALGVAPGLDRAFAMERWPTVAAGLGDEVREQLRAKLRESSAVIVGSDRDAGAIASAASNAERAGVADAVEFAARAISAAVFPGAHGWVVTNPPYGVRVGEEEKVRDLWAQFGRVLRERASGWTLCLLSPDPAMERQLGIALRVVAKTSNGGIPVRLLVGTVA